MVLSMTGKELSKDLIDGQNFTIKVRIRMGLRRACHALTPCTGLFLSSRRLS